jgi:TonB family protein
MPRRRDFARQSETITTGEDTARTGGGEQAPTAAVWGAGGKIACVLTHLSRRPIPLALCLGALACAPTRVSSHQMEQLRSAPTSCAAVASADSTIYDTTQVAEQPVPRTVPKIEYPAEARRQRIHGQVVVTAVVSPAGVVEPSSVAVIVSADALLSAEARRVVSLATFWPACREGMAVRSRIRVPFEFTLGADRATVGFGVLAGLWVGIMAAVME